MESWNQIINTALLGTDKRPFQASELTADMADTIELVIQNTDNKEDAFLQTAALLYNYRQCGMLPLKKEGANLPVAEPEVAPYANELAHQALSGILEMESMPLLQYWLRQCAATNKLVQPEMIPVLLDIGMRYKYLHALVQQCCGKRGEWLAAFNEGWKYTAPVDEEALWQTGTLDQRKKYLAAIRAQDPAKGRELLQQTWAAENAATRTELIQQLAIGLAEEDGSWLEAQLQEKSVKVKEEAMALLKQLPSSSIVQRYWQLLAPAIEVKMEKVLLGLSSKTVVEIAPVKEVDEGIYKTGIEKVSSEKKVSDAQFLLYQLIMAVPPSFFETHTGLEKAELLKAWLQSRQGKYLLPALLQGAIQFGEVDWLRAIIAQDSAHFFPEALSLLPASEAEAYALQHSEVEDHMSGIIEQLTSSEQEWSMELTRAIFRFTAKSPYQYSKTFYNNIIHVLPVSIINELETFAPPEDYYKTLWKTQSDYITQLATLKAETIRAFNE
jgi:Family of unknown function (DUF5691)